jgi:hypothetical protein
MLKQRFLPEHIQIVRIDMRRIEKRLARWDLVEAIRFLVIQPPDAPLIESRQTPQLRLAAKSPAPLSLDLLIA